MAIHFYKGGTSGAQDGTLISEGDLSNPLIVDGFYPASGVTLTKDVAIAVRADSGETWRLVQLGIKSSTLASVKKYSIVGGTKKIYWWNGAIAFLPTVTDKNQIITVRVSASGNETNSPDTSAKLCAFGGTKI